MTVADGIALEVDRDAAHAVIGGDNLHAAIRERHAALAVDVGSRLRNGLQRDGMKAIAAIDGQEPVGLPDCLVVCHGE